MSEEANEVIQEEALPGQPGMGSGQHAFVQAGEHNHPHTVTLVMQAVTNYDGKNKT